MSSRSLDDLTAFVAVAQAGGFTRAAAKLGVSQPALSQTIKALESRLGVRLLSRTTRSVAPTAAGEQLLRALTPALDAVEQAISALKTTASQPGGLLRLTADRHGYEQVLAPALPGFTARHPHIIVDVTLDDAFVDLVSDGFDAGLRLGAFLQKDMIAVAVGPDVRTAIVACPGYWKDHVKPKTPRDLNAHNCINYRVSRTGGLYPWQFEQEGRRVSVRVDGALVLNDGGAILRAAIDGLGVAYLFEDQVEKAIRSGRLVRVLEDWCPPMPGFHLYHSDRSLSPPALGALIAWLVKDRRALQRL